jgi:gamma-glutamylcyclotransferase (GGCT)/AIG2-like uncharacterized protein YtfP
MIRLFVYGTLRADAESNELMGKSILEQNAVTLRGYSLYDYEGEYPFGVSDSDGAVIGDVFLVDKDQLALLDEYEGDMYKRIEDRTYGFQLYIKADNDPVQFLKIDSGDWILYKDKTSE